MFTRNSIKNLTTGCLVLLVCLGKLVCPLKASREVFSTSGPQDIKLKIIKDPNMNFIHAELAIFYKNKNVNPAIRHLTMLNVFDEDVNQGGSGLLNTLKKLGNDFEVLDRPDYLLLKINFLQDRLPIFGQCLQFLELISQIQGLEKERGFSGRLPETFSRSSIGEYVGRSRVDNQDKPGSDPLFLSKNLHFKKFAAHRKRKFENRYRIRIDQPGFENFEKARDKKKVYEGEV
jgi:hypothetical protein